jgi:cell division protein ZipA
MPELRLTLMVVGGLFLVGLAWWELRRPHQARGSELPRPAPEPLERGAERSMDWDLPPLDLPRMSARDPEAHLPVVEVEPAQFAALESQAQGAPGRFDALNEDFSSDVDELAANETTAALHEDFSRDIDAPAAPAGTAVAPQMGGMDGLLEELGAHQTRDPPISDITESFRSGSLGDEPFEVESVTVRTVATAWSAPMTAAAPAPVPESMAAMPLPDLTPLSVVVDWPAPDASKVLAVRLISSGEKFSGRAVRLALAAEGFVLGKFSIFHKPGPDGRALLSIASLNKPGTFDSSSIDLQRFSGLNLFTVLPGPVPGPDAVDEMLVCAQVLSQRLRGTLQDDHGQPLSPARTALMRSTAAAASP